jgi:hypothetical protein
MLIEREFPLISLLAIPLFRCFRRKRLAGTTRPKRYSE